ncbi:MAG: hypothetical protein M3178_17850 [Pseudomonadota bacterium]|nr:hypothetical protein [Pseudomonadota bacterium]
MILAHRNFARARRLLVSETPQEQWFADARTKASPSNHSSRHAGIAPANLFRTQLKERGVGAGKHGFLLELPVGLPSGASQPAKGRKLSGQIVCKLEHIVCYRQAGNLAIDG